MQRFLLAAPLVLLTSACAMQAMQQNASDACESQGRRAFIADVKRDGMLNASLHGSYLCVGPDEIVHLPGPFDVDVLLATNLDGVGILAVTPGSIADKAGLRRNDLVREFAGAPVRRAAELQAAVAQMEPGSQARIRVRRSGEDKLLTAQF